MLDKSCTSVEKELTTCSWYWSTYGMFVLELKCLCWWALRACVCACCAGAGWCPKSESETAHPSLSADCFAVSPTVSQPLERAQEKRSSWGFVCSALVCASSKRSLLERSLKINGYRSRRVTRLEPPSFSSSRASFFEYHTWIPKPGRIDKNLRRVAGEP